MRVIVLVALLMASTIAAQENAQVNILSSRECSISCDIIKAIETAGPGWIVAIDSPYLSDQDIITALRNAVSEGVRVTINTCEKSPNAFFLQQLQHAGAIVHYNPRLHTKRVLIADMIPDAKTMQIKQSLVYVGSDNMSKISPYHVETMTKTENDIGLFYEHWRDHQNIAQNKLIQTLPGVVTITPKKRTACSSLNTNLEKTVSLRLKSQKSFFDEQDRYEFTSMSFNSNRIVDQVEKIMVESENIQPLVRFHLSQVVLENEKTKKQLDRLNQIGAQVFIYNTQKDRNDFGYELLQHGKSLARKRVNADGSIDYLYMALTGNLTEHADREINSIEMHPNDKDLVGQQFALNEMLREQSTPYWELYEQNL